MEGIMGMKRLHLIAAVLIFALSACRTATISGTITHNDVPLENVLVMIQGSAARGTYTDADGRFSFTNLQPGKFEVSPALEGYAFDPEKRQVTLVGADSLKTDFRAVMMNPCGSPGLNVSACQDGDELSIGNSLVSLRYSLKTGRYSIFDDKSSRVIDSAETVVYSNVVAPVWKWNSSGMKDYEWQTLDAVTPLGDGKRITISRKGGLFQPELSQSFTLIDGKSCVIVDAGIKNTFSWDIKIGAIYALMAEGLVGRLNFGSSPDLRILTNGFLNYLDFLVPIQPGTAPVLSNWSSLIYNQETGKSLLAGFLTYETAEPIVYTGPGPLNEGQAIQIVSQFEPAKKLSSGQGLASETMILDFGQATPQLALETYAGRIKTWLGIRTWLERHPGMKVPVGWNSWSGSSSSGGYGTGINEDIILENMGFADRELRRWGMNYFQIDDGWQTEKGDWQVNSDRFPAHGDMNGLEWLMRRAKGLGFIPGVWIQGFNASENSDVFKGHPGWFAGPLFNGLIEQGDKVFDLSDPDATAYLKGVVQNVKDWGAEWVKLDFAYTAIMSEDWDEPNLTRGEFYRKGVKLFREALGDEVFFLNVAIVGYNYGLIDSCRLTLDTMPAWEGEEEDPYSLSAYFSNQGLKPMYRDCARRYYLNNRVWINHPDLIFFRAHQDAKVPPLTFSESATFATAVAMQGGIVKIGDRLVDLKPEEVDCLRRIMPVYEKGGRPLDLFERDFPEVWSIDVGAFDEPYHVMGFLNWGKNRDLTKSGYPFIDDSARVLHADFKKAGIDHDQKFLAFEFWTQKFLGEVLGSLSLEVPAHSPRVVALRPKLGRPLLLGTNRHIAGGAGVIRSVKWNEEARTLTGLQEGSVGTALAPFEHRLTFYAPEGYELSDAEVAIPEGFIIANRNVTVDGNLVHLNFTVMVDINIAASRQWHPDVKWELKF
jgi:hypothetical protein